MKTKNRFCLWSILLLTTIFTQKTFAQWERVLPSANSVSEIIANNEVVLAVVDSELYRSSDNGDTWEVSSNGLMQKTLNKIFNIEGTNIFYAISNEYIYKSTDNGKDWAVISGECLFSGLRLIYYYKGSLFVADASESNRGLYRSNDDGKTWVELSNGLTSKRINSLVNDGEYLYAGLSGTGPGSSPGVFRSKDNGDTWEFASTGFEKDIYHLVLVDNRIYACFYATVYYSDNQGESWNYTISGSLANYPIAQLITVGNTILAAHIVAGISKLEDGIITWEYYKDGLNANFLQGLTSDSVYTYCCTTDAGIWRRPVTQLGGTNTSLSYIKKNTQITISPNPVSGILYLEQLPETTAFDLKIMDIHGRVIYSQKSFSQESIDVSELQAGVYFLSLQNNKEIYNARFVKK